MESLMFYYTFSVINTTFVPWTLAVRQHSNNSTIKVVLNYIEYFLRNPSDLLSDDVLSCLWIVFTNSVFQVHPQKIVRRVEILGKGWPGVIGLTRNEFVSRKVMPDVFKCSVREMRWCLISRTEHLSTSDITYHETDSICDNLTFTHTPNYSPSTIPHTTPTNSQISHKYHTPIFIYLSPPSFPYSPTT